VQESDYPGAGANSPLWDSWQIEQLGAWLRQLPAGSAVMACNDVRARQIVRAAAAVGLRVPEDVAVLGVNNDPTWCELSTPEISSIAVNSFDAGCRAAELLDGWMAGRVPASLEVRIEPVGVVARKSTDVLSLRDRKVALALDYIKEHACRGINVEQVINFVHASRSLMESRFRRYVGHSPQAEIRRVQVERIRHLLTTTDLALKEIADQAGFAHVEYMCVLFKRMTGETMGQFRRNVRAQEQVRALA
jgi:LacI family transcriptional regulator